ncbi:MAG: rhodanese-like domain-containing protein [Desulfobacterales bacterium]|nr:rhodanese-like domain-containing protein [Desulfobacterales bacterium]
MTIDDEWQNIQVNKISPSEMLPCVDQKDIYILDVRPLDFEKDTHFIKNSAFCPLVFLADQYTKIPKNKKIITTDWAMKQSPTAARFLIKQGYNVLGTLKGGVERWRSENYPVENRDPKKVDGLLLPVGK